MGNHFNLLDIVLQLSLNIVCSALYGFKGSSVLVNFIAVYSCHLFLCVCFLFVVCFVFCCLLFVCFVFVIFCFAAVVVVVLLLLL